jgi:hypothetical protein
MDEPHYNEEQVSGGRQEHVVRWVLGASLLLIVIAMTLVWVIPSLLE